MPKKSYKQILADLCANQATITGSEEKRNALDDRVGALKLTQGELVEEAINLGHGVPEIAKDTRIREELLLRWLGVVTNHPAHSRPPMNEVIVSFSVYEELDGPNRHSELRQLIKAAKDRAKPGKTPRVVVEDVRRLHGKAPTRYAPPPRTTQEKAAKLAEYLADPEVADTAISDVETRTAISRAYAGRNEFLTKHTRSRERDFGPLDDANSAWDAHNKVERATGMLQAAYDEYATLGALNDNDRARAQQLVARLQLVASYLDSLVNGGQPLDQALADILGGTE